MVTGTLAGFSRDQATEAVDVPRRQGQRARCRRRPTSWSSATTRARKYDKAMSLKVPVLDEDGFRVLLADGPDAAREMALSDET